MKKLLLLLGLVYALHALTLQDLVRDYAKGHYRSVCLNGYKLFDQIKRDENLDFR